MMSLISQFDWITAGNVCSCDPETVFPSQTR
jgi:hypothetical protein